MTPLEARVEAQPMCHVAFVTRSKIDGDPQAPDHPVLLSFPESEYLKGLICRAL